jgi:hypothetical protein
VRGSVELFDPGPNNSTIVDLVPLEGINSTIATAATAPQPPTQPQLTSSGLQPARANTQLLTRPHLVGGLEMDQHVGAAGQAALDLVL